MMDANEPILLKKLLFNSLQVFVNIFHTYLVYIWNYRPETMWLRTDKKLDP